MNKLIFIFIDENGIKINSFCNFNSLLFISYDLKLKLFIVNPKLFIVNPKLLNISLSNKLILLFTINKLLLYCSCINNNALLYLVS